MNKFRINTMIDNLKHKMLLKPKYRLVFCMTLCFILTIMIGVIAEIMSRITDVINYIVWGIK